MIDGAGTKLNEAQNCASLIEAMNRQAKMWRAIADGMREFREKLIEAKVRKDFLLMVEGHTEQLDEFSDEAQKITTLIERDYRLLIDFEGKLPMVPEFYTDSEIDLTGGLPTSSCDGNDVENADDVDAYVSAIEDLVSEAADDLQDTADALGNDADFGSEQCTAMTGLSALMVEADFGVLASAWQDDYGDLIELIGQGKDIPGLTSFFAEAVGN